MMRAVINIFQSDTLQMGDAAVVTMMAGCFAVIVGFIAIDSLLCLEADTIPVAWRVIEAVISIWMVTGIILLLILG